MVERNESKDPVVIGYCDACGYPIYDNDEYYDLDGVKIHAEGVGAKARIMGTELYRNISCIFLYLQGDHAEDETAKLFGFERRNA